MEENLQGQGMGAPGVGTAIREGVTTVATMEEETSEPFEPRLQGGKRESCTEGRARAQAVRWECVLGSGGR